MATLITQSGSDGRKRRCDAHCYNAKHSRCTCICGGHNHGQGLEKAIENTAEMAKDLLRWKDAEIAKVLTQIEAREAV